MLFFALRLNIFLLQMKTSISLKLVLETRKRLAKNLGNRLNVMVMMTEKEVGSDTNHQTLEFRSSFAEWKLPR